MCGRFVLNYTPPVLVVDGKRVLCTEGVGVLLFQVDRWWPTVRCLDGGETEDGDR